MYRAFRLATSPAILCTSFAIVLLAMVQFDVDLPSRLTAFTAAHATWQAGKILNLLVVSRIFVSILVIRWGILLHHEIKVRREAERKALQLARHDPLTGLPNRRVFKEVLSETLATLRPGDSVGVMFVDLDGFKSINDFYGHAVGDDVLCMAADRLRAAVGQDRMLARLGGDEFAVMCDVGASPTRLELIAARIVDAIAEPFECHDRKVRIGASVGIAVGPRDGAEVVDVLRAADEAMYRAKSAGKGRFRLFDPDSKVATRGRAELKAELREAIATGQIIPHYQPMVDLTANRICGFEAFARWRHPRHGVLLPDAFMPVIEDMQMSARLAMSLLEQICRDAKRWPAHYQIMINLSSMQLRDAVLREEICRTIRVSGIDPARFEMEITESLMMENLQAACAAIDGLRAQGIGVALDNFGNGYSSLHHLRTLHFDRVKIDRPLINGLDRDPRAEDYVRAIIGVCTSLRLEVVAEGIETPEVLAVLQNLGCRFGQGYLFAQPLPAEALVMMLNVTPAPRSGRGILTAAE